MGRECELLSARARESVQDSTPERRPVKQQEPMLRPHLDSKRRQRNPNRQMTVEDHVDHPRHVERNERGSSRSPTPPPPSSATKDTGEPVRFLSRPHGLPPARDNETAGTTALPRPFPVLPQVRRFETPVAEQPGVELVSTSTPHPPPAAVTPIPAPRVAPRTTLTAGSATPQPATTTTTVNSSASSSVTMPIPGQARLMAVSTSTDHQEFRALVTVAVTMPQSVQEQMYAAFFDKIRRAQ
ncbi:hypothetical protein QAD02_007625 [Eretmocerus hayati]|uniref:Uncharacterized protein n=1 Tax=Eretmocerus hayati TaxID=131215 RepID=A0ACC2N480_9HYME|nr:hypothetical protein QAD02_007625 [Eretmocerus hayati]